MKDHLVTILIIITVILNCGKPKPYNITKQKMIELYQLNKYRESIKPAEETLKAAITEFGSSHTNTLSAYIDLARIYHINKNFSKAEKYYNKSINLSYKIFSKDNLKTAKLIEDTAFHYFDRENFDKAEKLCKKALAIKKSLLGENNPETAKTINNLGNIYVEKSIYKKAEDSYKKAIDITINTSGKNHPDLISYYNNLAVLYHIQKEFNKAEKYYLLVLNIINKEYGKYSPEYAAALIPIGNILSIKNPDAALKKYILALSIYDNSPNPDYPHITAVLENMAEIYENEGNTIEAEKLNARAKKLHIQYK